MTRNSVIDGLLKQGKSTEEIIATVLKEFKDSPLPALKRQVYSRRNAVKSQAPKN